MKVRATLAALFLLASCGGGDDTATPVVFQADRCGATVEGSNSTFTGRAKICFTNVSAEQCVSTNLFLMDRGAGYALPDFLPNVPISIGIVQLYPGDCSGVTREVAITP